MLNKIKLLTLLITAVLMASMSSSAMAQGAQGAQGAQEAQEARMSTEDRAKVIRLLNESNKQTLASIEGLSNEQLHFKAAPEKWSVLEVAEHIMMAEGLLFSQVEAAIAAKPNPDWQEKTKGKTEFLEKVMVSRDRKMSDAATVSSHEAVSTTGKTVSPKDEVSPDGVRQYRLNLAREAKRFKRYPPLARQRGWEGVVIVLVSTVASGLVPQVSLSQSSGFELLDQEALELVSQAVHTASVPENLRNRPFGLTLPIHYRLDD